MPNQDTLAPPHLRTYLFAVLLIGAMAALYTFDSKVATLGDNATYYQLGEALANGQGYTNTNSLTPQPANHFPPGYPALIAGVKVTFGAQIFGTKLLNCALFVLSLYFLFQAMFRITKQLHLTLAISLGCALNTHLLEFSSLMMSEIPFFFWGSLVLYGISRHNSEFRWKDTSFWIVLIAAIASSYTRSIGITLIVALVFFYLINKQWKKAGVFLGGWALATLPWSIRNMHLGGNSYLKNMMARNALNPEAGQMEWADWLPRIGRNLERIIGLEIPNLVIPQETAYLTHPEWWMWLLGLSILLLTVLGLWQLKQWRRFLLGYGFFTIGLLCLWPEIWIGPRFIFPLLPIIFLGMFSFFWKVAKRFASKRKRIPQETIQTAAVYGLLGITLFCSLPRLHQVASKAKAPYTEAKQHYKEMAEWAADYTPENALIACRKPALFHLFSKRACIRYPYTTDNELFIHTMTAQGVDYVVFDGLLLSSQWKFLVPAAESAPHLFAWQFGFAKTPSQLFLFDPMRKPTVNSTAD